jgi:anti-sigma-K factor RskA
MKRNQSGAGDPPAELRGRDVRATSLAAIVVVIILFATGLNSQEKTSREPFIVQLDVAGKRGVVYFDHDSHDLKISPDPAYPYPAKADATCAGCHHSTNNVGVIQLVKCSACHLPPGDAKNPKDKELNEISTDEAFHRNCIGCHRFSKNAPRLCTGCHLSETTDKHR